MIPSQAVRERQPFFKPLTSADTGMLQLSSNSKTSFAGQQYFAPVSQQLLRAKAQEMPVMNSQLKQQPQVHQSERLTVLHAKLHQEAEKIRKWKVQTEIEIKQKDKKIEESHQTIDSLRKSILELQIQSEQLSLKLQEEMENREDILQKIDATRDMCNVLKDYTARVENRLQACEKDKTELKYLEKEHLQNLEELASQFTELEITATNTQNNLKNELSNKEEENHQLKETFEAQLLNNDQKIQELLQKSEEKNDMIRVMKNELEKQQTSLEQLQETQGALQHQLSESQQVVVNQNSQLEVTSYDLKETKEAKQHLEASLQQVSSELDDTRVTKDRLIVTYDEKIESMSKELQQVTEDWTQAKLRLAELQDNYFKSQTNIEELKSAKDGLIMEKTDADEKVKQHECTIRKLTKELESIEENCTQLTLSKSTLMEEIEEYKLNQENCKELIVTLKHDLEETSIKNHSVVSELEAVTDELERKRESYQLLTEQFQQLTTEKKSVSKELSNSKKEFAKLQKELENKLDRASDETNTVREENTELKGTISELEEKLEQETELKESLLQNKDSTHKALQNQLEKKTKSASDFENKSKSMKEDLTVKIKHIKELEKELKSLKNKLSSQNTEVSTLDEKYNNMKIKLDNTKIEKEKLAKTVKEWEQYGSTKEDEITALKKEMQTFKRNAEQAIEDKKKAEVKLESELAQMTAALEKYGLGNQKIVSEKDKEILSLKCKLEHLEQTVEQANNSLKEEVEKHQAENTRLEADMKLKLEEMKELQTTIQKFQHKPAPVACPPQTPKHSSLTPAKSPLPAAAPFSSTTHKVQQKVVAEVSPHTSVMKTPQKPVMKPSQKPTMKTPQRPTAVSPDISTMKTPQRSILKQYNASVKRRKVVFASEDDMDSDDSEEQWMEVNVDELENQLLDPKRQCRTPILVRPSPNVRKSPASQTPQTSKKTYDQSLGSAPRKSMPVTAQHPKKAKVDSLKENNSEIEQFKKLFPNNNQAASMIQTEKPKNKDVSKLKSNIKKTPAKQTPKFFKSSPSDRKKKEKETKHVPISWFDSDSVFGFDAED